MSDEIVDVKGNFDWVVARAKCTPFLTFEKLRVQVKDDTAKRNQLAGTFSDDRRNFYFNPDGSSFSVSYRGSSTGMHSGVTFSLSANGVNVAGIETQRVLCVGILTISNSGICKIRVGEKKLTLWQFRKLALQDLFYTVKEEVQA